MTRPPMPTLSIHPFLYADQDHVEEGSRYCPGGFCPIRLGELLGPDASSPRYRIFAKLGYGAYATVWLAHDQQENKSVALKIVEAASSVNSREAAILERLRAPEGSHVVQLIDAFTHHSANGGHQVIVTEPVVPLRQFLQLPGVKVDMKDLLRQALDGLAHIHARGIAHGDLHPSNLGVAIPELRDYNEMDIVLLSNWPEFFPLISLDPVHDPASFPPYLSTALDIGKFLLRKTPDWVKRAPQLRILDLGNAYIIEESPRPRCNTPALYVAPEVAFPAAVHKDMNGPWECPADIWSLAATISEMAANAELFWGCGIGSGLLIRMACHCAGAPEEWIQYFAGLPVCKRPRGAFWERLKIASPLTSIDNFKFTTECADTLWAEHAKHMVERGPGISEEDAEALVRLLWRMLVIDPKKRPSALELLQDPYFLAPVANERTSTDPYVAL
ncbi:kinase-like domain-containing protein [Mycena pura]|uniref:non-specific serine/threonine protein kinase n=1 Tax=Mycena pura TaxID=153505 RepID=A0AAD6VFV4_9AGAR|nr:kinase-like domain-containing protein [Mycena pura]